MRFEQEVNIFNPSALNRKFSAIQTNFDVTLGKISAIISDSDIEQYQDGHTTMHSRLSSTIQDLDGFRTQVSEMQTEYDEEFVSVNSRLTTFDETLDGITASVSTVSQEAIKADQIHYLATSASSGVRTDTPGWSTTPQRISSTNKYLWIYHTYTRGDDTPEDTDPVIAGVWGDRGLQGETGVSIAGVTNYYLASPLSSGVTTDTSGWTTGIQTMTAQNQYLWNYEVVYGSNDAVISTSDPIIIGRYGQNGANGTNGANGRGITSITEHYNVSSSNTVAPSRWYDTMVNTTTENRYLWNYETIAYTDGTTEDSTKRVIGTHGEKGDSPTVYEIRTTADAIVRSQEGSPSPAFVTFTCYRRVGNGDATTQSCYWVIEEYVNGSWTSIEAGGSATSTKTRYVGANATSVRATAYLDSAMSSSSRLDSQDVPVISNGSDGYTVVLSNESHTFGGSVSAAVSGSTQSSIIAYKGTTRVAATIGTITGQPTGMTTSISNNGTTSARFTVDVTTAMTTRSGTLNVPVTVDGKSFTLVFSYAVAFKGETGNAGINTATVYLYRLLTSTTTPAGPVNSTTYRFSTKTLSGTPGNSWSTTLPSGSGTLWMAVATASSNVDTDTIEANEWVVTKLARDGIDGVPGTDGYNKATITLYRRYASTPSRPSTQVTYTFSTGALSAIPSGWSLSIPAVDANHNPCYATSVSAVSQADTYTIASSAWTTPVKIVEDGEDGIGLTATTPIRYVSSSTTAPAKPQSNVKVTESRPITGAWTTALPALTSTYKYIYTCDMLEWDNGTITYTDVVLNNSLSDLVTRVSEAEFKIRDDAIVATVRNSESYKSDLSSKNATYSGSGIPTASNYPANAWTTNAEKQMHVNDTYLTNSGKLYQYVQGSNGLRITFSDDSVTEQRYDYARIYYQRDNKTYVLPDLTGTAIAGATVFVPTNSFWIYWKTDTSVTKYGFRITSIDWVFDTWTTASEGTLPSVTAIDTSGTNYPETDHPYNSSEEKMWKYTTSNTETPSLSYQWVLREDPEIRALSERMSSAELKITDSSIVSTVRASADYQSDLNGVKNSTIKTDTLYYLATSASSGVTTSTSGWTTTAQSMDSTKKYLWTYHKYTYGNNTTSNSVPVITGRYGTDGANGTNGRDGTNGTNGTNGTDGLSVTAITTLYYASSSNSSAPSLSTSSLPITRTSTSTGQWTTVVPTMTTTYKYIWTCDQIKYSNNTYSITNIVLMTKAIESVIEQTADAIRLKADKIAWSSTYSTMTENGVLSLINNNYRETFGSFTFDTIRDTGSQILVDSADGTVISILPTSGTTNNAKYYVGTWKPSGSSNSVHEFIEMDATTGTIDGSTMPIHANKTICVHGITGSPRYIYYNAISNLDGERFVCYRRSGSSITRGHSFLHTDSEFKYVARDGRNWLTLDKTGTTGRGNFQVQIANASNTATGELRMYADTTGTINFQYNGRNIQVASSSSRRYKHDIGDLQHEALDPHKLYDLKPKQFVFNDAVPLQYEDMKGQVLPGFIAEDVAQLYPAAIIHDPHGQIENWDERRIIPAMLALIQEQNERIKALEAMMN